MIHMLMERLKIMEEYYVIENFSIVINRSRSFGVTIRWTCHWISIRDKIIPFNRTWKFLVFTLFLFEYKDTVRLELLSVRRQEIFLLASSNEILVSHKIDCKSFTIKLLEISGGLNFKLWKKLFSENDKKQKITLQYSTAAL